CFNETRRGSILELDRPTEYAVFIKPLPVSNLAILPVLSDDDSHHTRRVDIVLERGAFQRIIPVRGDAPASVFVVAFIGAMEETVHGHILLLYLSVFPIPGSGSAATFAVANPTGGQNL